MITNNLCQRIIEHYLNRGTGRSFTGKYYCYCLVYYERHSNINDAIAREKELKILIRVEKNKILDAFNTTWPSLIKKIVKAGHRHQMR